MNKSRFGGVKGIQDPATKTPPVNDALKAVATKTPPVNDALKAGYGEGAPNLAGEKENAGIGNHRVCVHVHVLDHNIDIAVAALEQELVVHAREAGAEHLAAQRR